MARRKRNGHWDNRRYCKICKRRRRRWRSGAPPRKRWGVSLTGAPMCYVCVARQAELDRLNLETSTIT